MSNSVPNSPILLLCVTFVIIILIIEYLLFLLYLQLLMHLVFAVARDFTLKGHCILNYSAHFLTHALSVLCELFHTSIILTTCPPKSCGSAGAYRSSHWARGGLHFGQVTGLTTIHICRQFRVISWPNVHVFGRREEAGLPGENSTQKAARPTRGFEPRPYLLWGNGANNCIPCELFN